jgi:hypothetical protein
MHSLRTYLLQALADPAARGAAGPQALLSAENLCHQAIFAPSAATPLDPELIEVGDTSGAAGMPGSGRGAAG